MTTLRDEENVVSGRAATRNGVGVGSRRSERFTNPELLDALGVAVYMTDAAGVITEFNEAAVALWGRRPEVGKDEWCGSWRLYWPDGKPMQHGECPMALTLKENRAIRDGEAIAERPDGSRVCFMAYPTPLRNDAGALVGAVNVLVDITGRKAAEQALRENEARLTDALAVKDEFLGLISHELKTPITTILGNARVLARSQAQLNEDDRLGALGDIAEESERLHAIIDDLLMLARADASEPLEFEPTRIGRVVSDCVADFRRKYPRRTFALLRDTNPLVDADTTYVRQVMTNLLSNAVKYSPIDAPIEVDVEAGSACVRVHVLDRGRGIAEGEQDKIFESFYRSPATSRTASGIGVGLAVCKRLVEAMGGEMWASNRSDGGADIGFSLATASEEAED